MQTRFSNCCNGSKRSRKVDAVRFQNLPYLNLLKRALASSHWLGNWYLWVGKKEWQPANVSFHASIRTRNEYLLRRRYFAQHHVDTLNPAMLPVQFLASRFPGKTEQEYRNHLANFQISGMTGKVWGSAPFGRARLNVLLCVIGCSWSVRRLEDRNRVWRLRRFRWWIHTFYYSTNPRTILISRSPLTLCWQGTKHVTLTDEHRAAWMRWWLRWILGMEVWLSSRTTNGSSRRCKRGRRGFLDAYGCSVNKDGHLALVFADATVTKFKGDAVRAYKVSMRAILGFDWVVTITLPHQSLIVSNIKMRPWTPASLWLVKEIFAAKVMKSRLVVWI